MAPGRGKSPQYFVDIKVLAQHVRAGLDGAESARRNIFCLLVVFETLEGDTASIQSAKESSVSRIYRPRPDRKTLRLKRT